MSNIVFSYFNATFFPFHVYCIMNGARKQSVLLYWRYIWSREVVKIFAISSIEESIAKNNFFLNNNLLDLFVW